MVGGILCECSAHLLYTFGTFVAFTLLPLLLELLHPIVEAYSLLPIFRAGAERWNQTTDLQYTQGISACISLFL